MYYINQVQNVFSYEGFGHVEPAGMGETLYFYLPATPLCKLIVNKDGFMDEDTPTVTVLVENQQLVERDGAYWFSSGSEVTIGITGLPGYMNIDHAYFETLSTGAMTDYALRLTQDTTTGDYAIERVNIYEDTEFSLALSSNIEIRYECDFVNGDRHTVEITDAPTEYVLGSTVLLNSNTVKLYCPDLVFNGWISRVTGGKITQIDPNNFESIMTDESIIPLVAQWKAAAVFTTGDKNGTEISRVEVEYGNTSRNVLIPDGTGVPEKEHYEFAGWVVEGTTDVVYEPGEQYSFVPTKNVTFEPYYIRSDFYVYIDASPTKFNKDNVDVYVGKVGAPVTDANNLIEKDANGNYLKKTVNNKDYYYAIVKDGESLAVILSPKTGLVLSGDTITIQQGSGSGMVVNIGNSDSGEITISQLDINSDDVYVSTSGEFSLKEYELTFYDGLTATGGARLWSDEDIVYTIEDLDKTYGEILEYKAYEVLTLRDRFYEFKGWKDKLTGEIYLNTDKLEECHGDMVLIAQWEEVDKYPVNVYTIDDETMEESQNIYAVLYYVNADGEVEPMYTEDIIDDETGLTEAVPHAAANDKMLIKFYYTDKNGRAQQISEGFDLKGIDIKYIDVDGNEAVASVNEGVTQFVCPKAMHGSIIDVYATIHIQEYTITYWDTKGIEHNNPTSYTYFDEVVFEELVEGVGWLLITVNNDVTSYDQIKVLSITQIEKGTSGNLVLKPNWGEYEEEKYLAEIEDPIEHGTVEMVFPVNQIWFTPDETLVITAIPDRGYKMKSNTIYYREMERVGLYSRLISPFSLTREAVIPASVEVTGNNGTYLINMPAMDILISTEFEIIHYNITYIEVGDLQNDNVTTYTVEDVIEMIPLQLEGAEFLGWMDEDGNIINNIVNQTGDMVLKPVFKEITDVDDDGVIGDIVGSPGTEEIETDPVLPGSIENVTQASGEVSQKVEPETETKKPHIVGGGNIFDGEVYTGDTTNVSKMIFICAAAVILLVIIVITKKDDDEEEESKDSQEENQDKGAQI